MKEGHSRDEQLLLLVRELGLGLCKGRGQLSCALIPFAAPQQRVEDDKAVQGAEVGPL